MLKSAPSGSQRGAEPTTCKGPERLLRTSAVSDLDVPTTYLVPQVRFLSLQVFVTAYCANATTTAGVGTNVDIRSSNSFLVQRICLHSDTHRQSHWKRSYDPTADSFSQSPMLSATRSPKQASEGAQNQTRE